MLGKSGCEKTETPLRMPLFSTLVQVAAHIGAAAEDDGWGNFDLEGSPSDTAPWSKSVIQAGRATCGRSLVLRSIAKVRLDAMTEEALRLGRCVSFCRSI